MTRPATQAALTELKSAVAQGQSRIVAAIFSHCFGRAATSAAFRLAVAEGLIEVAYIGGAGNKVYRPAGIAAAISEAPSATKHQGGSVIVPHEDRVTPWSPFDGFRVSHVRIWARQTPFGMFQRHEWRNLDGSEWCEAWIRSSGPRWPVGAAAVPACADEAETMFRALLAICEGHNDARALAAETLALIGTEK